MHLIQKDPMTSDIRLTLEKEGKMEGLRPVNNTTMLDTNLGFLNPFIPFIILVIAAFLGGYIIKRFNLPSWTNWVVGGLLLLALLVIVF